MRNLFLLGAAIFAVLNHAVCFQSLLYDTFEEVPTYNVHKRHRTSDTVANTKDNLRDGDEKSQMYHLDFNQRELADIFGCNHYADVPKYYPAVVSGIRKLRRNEHHQVTVKTLGKEIKMNLSKNEKNIPDTHTTEIYSADGKVKNFTGVLGEFSIGHVQGDDLSHVGFHHNGKGISGYLSTHNDMLIIKPLPRRVQNDDANHIVYRLFDLPDVHPINQYVKFIDSTSEDGINMLRRRRRSVDTPQYPKKTMELMIVADWKMYEYFGEDVLPQYILNVGNIVAGFFRDPSLEYPIDVVVTRTVIWENDVLNATELNISDELGKFNHWVRLNNDYDNDDDPNHVDVAYLLTRKTSSKEEALGLAYGDTICFKTSVGVGRDKGLMFSSTTMAHEIGHILGADHDSTEECPGATFIMAPASSSGGKSLKWSPCSSRQLKASLLKTTSSCLDDVPSHKLTDSHYQLYGQVYNASQQCKFVNKDYDDVCWVMKDRCDILFCHERKRNPCSSTITPPAHGTKCGDRKWCIGGYCVPDGSPAPVPIDGGWSSWTYTECSRPCGVGVQWRERACNAPEPANGGAWCDPTSKKRGVEKDGYRTCNKQNCIKDESTGEEYLEGTMFGSTLDDLNALCSKHKDGTKYAKVPKSSPCQLICGSSHTDNVYSGNDAGNVQDGTACTSRKTNRDGVCIHGECVERGCDFEINSTMEKDRCGKCGGNGEYCEPVSGRDDRPHKQQHNTKRSRVTVIPAGAYQVEIAEEKKTVNFLGISYENSAKSLIQLPSFSKNFNDEKEGLSVQYVMEDINYADKLIIKGTVKKDLVIWVYNFYNGEEHGITWKYMKTLTVPGAVGKSTWWSGAWQDCTKSCGGDGKQIRDVRCHREDATVVNPSKCPQENQPSLDQPCNRIDCPARWVISAWSTCTKICGSGGERTRTIKCVSLTKDGEEKIVDESECATPKPTITKVCNAKDCAPRWEIKSEFGACSKRCGGGVMTRKVECWRIKKDGSDKKEPEFACDKIVDPPAKSKVCNADEPCPSWRTKYTSCSVTCGHGKQVGAIVCASEVQEFDASWCTDPKPTAPTRNCNEGPCTGHIWISYDGECSKTCGGGEMSTFFECEDIQTGVMLGVDECDDHTKPPATVNTCNSDVCPKTHIWKVTYAECTAVCGGGTQSSIPHCYRTVDVKVVDDNDCDMTLKPAVVTQPCNTHKCTHKENKMA